MSTELRGGILALVSIAIGLAASYGIVSVLMAVWRTCS